MTNYEAGYAAGMAQGAAAVTKLLDRIEALQRRADELQRQLDKLERGHGGETLGERLRRSNNRTVRLS